MNGPTVIFETVHGSTAYGLARAGSDVDLKGVIVGPRSWYLGWRPAPEQLELTPDHVRFEIRKLFRLLAGGNPNALEIVYAPERCHRLVTAPGERLLAGRDRFLSRRVAERYLGFADSQRKRIEAHRRWLLDPPTRPTGGDVAAQRRWREYSTWVAHRNPARSELEARHGYDTKHAMHLVRILRMAVEILNDGAVVVERPDRDDLLAVRDGAWTYERLLDEIDALRAAVDDAAQASPLPPEPDDDALDELCAAIVSDVIGARGCSG